MNKSWLLALALLPGCFSRYDDGGGWRGGGDELQSFEVDTNECSLVSSLALSGSSTTWNACRLRYDSSTQIYSWQFITPGTTGSWTSQGPGWFTLSFNVNSPQNQTLLLSNVTTAAPTFAPVDQAVFAYAPSAGATVGGTGSVAVGANIIYPDGDNSALAAQLNVDAVGFGTFTGSLSATIVPATGVVDAAIDPCDGDGGCVD